VIVAELKFSGSYVTIVRKGVIALESRPYEKAVWNSGSAGAQHEMQNQGDYSKQQQQVNESAGHVEHGKATNPSNQ
jgi:hypothetical protein